MGQFLRFQFGRRGVVRNVIGPWLAYLKPGFHPWQHDNTALGQAWLKENQDASRRSAVRRLLRHVPGTLIDSA